MQCIADSGFQVTESNERDNLGSTTIPITQAGPPDLVVEQQAADPVWQQGGQASVSAFVYNRGDQATGSTRLGYYLVNTSFGVDRLLGTDDVSSLNPGSRSSESATFTVPTNISPGVYVVRFRADLDNDENEGAGESNNDQFAFGIQVVAPAVPDVSAQSVTVSPTSAAVGASVNATCSARNTGSATTPSVVKLSMSFVSGSQSALIGVADTGTLGAGQTVTRTLAGTVPSWAPPGGSITVRCVAVYVDDPDISNNTVNTPLAITAPATPPDVAAQSVTVSPTSAAVGASVNATCSARNLGSATTPSAVKLSMAFVSGSQSALIGIADTGSLGAGQTVTRTLAGTVPSWAPPGGSITVQCIVIYVDDPNTSNNSVTTPLAVTGPQPPAGPPVLTAVSPNPAPGIDGPQTLELTGSAFPADAAVFLNDVTNSDGPNLKYPVTLTASRITISANLTNTNASWTARVVSPTTGVSATVGFTVTTQGTAQGPPTVASIDPSPLRGSATAQPVIIRGTGFSPSSRVYFTDLTFTTSYPASSRDRVEFLSSTSLRVLVGVGTLASNWTVAVETDGRRSAALAFTVTGAGAAPGSAPGVPPSGIAITDISPESVPGGAETTVVLTGYGFGTAPQVTVQRAGAAAPQTVTASATDARVSFSFAFPDDATSYTITVAAGGRSATTRLSVVPPAGAATGTARLGGLTFSGATVVQRAPGVKVLSGGVSVNDALFFSGTVTVDENVKTVQGTGQIYVPRGTGSTVLYDGAFSFGFDAALDRLTAPGLAAANTRLALAKLPVRIDGLTVVAGGVRVEGRLTLPSLLAASAEITTLTVTRSGIAVTGAITLPPVRLVGSQLSLTGASLTFDSATNSLAGSGRLVTPLATISADVSVVERELDSVVLFVEPARPIPIASTGLSASGGGGSLRNLRAGPVELSLRTSLVPSVPGGANVVELSNVTLTLTQGSGFRGEGAFKLFGTSLASATLDLNKTGGEIGGQVNLLSTLTGRARLGIRGDAAGLRVTGSVDGQLTITAAACGGGVWCRWVAGVAGLPYDAGAVSATLSGPVLTGGFAVPVLRTTVRAGAQLTYASGRITAKFGTDFAPGGRRLFPTDATFVDLDHGDREAVLVSAARMNRGATLSAASVAQAFEVETDYRALILRVRRPDGATPAPRLTLPGGAVVSNTSQILGASLTINDVDHEAFFTISAPLRGTYSVAVDGAAAELTAIVAEEDPSILLEPLRHASGTVGIAWADANTGGALGLFYDRDAEGTDGTPIVEGILESDDADAYTWTPGADVPTGDYFVYGLVDNGGVAAVSYSPNTVRVVTPGAPAAPTGVSALVTPDGLVARWTPEGELGYRVYVSDRGHATFQSRAYDAPLRDRTALPAIVPGRTYTVAVAALDADGRESTLSDAAAVTYVSTTQNNAPTAAALPALAVTQPGQTLTLNAAGTDPDGEALTYALLSAPAGLTLSAAGQISWQPGPDARGEHLVRVRISDAAGLSDSSDVRVRVVVPGVDRGTVGFGSTVYAGTTDPAIVVLSDLRQDADPERADILDVSVWSSSAPTPVALQLRESRASSGLFLGSRPLVTAPGVGTLVAPGDTLFARYSVSGQEDQIGIALFQPGVGVVAEASGPVVYMVAPPSPNPASNRVVLAYSVSAMTSVRVDIFDVTGRLVQTLADGPVEPGEHRLVWEPAVPSGIYLVRFHSSEGGEVRVVTRRVTIAR